MQNKKNLTLEIFKLIASYMVVFIHVCFYGKIGAAVDALARFAVPFFFVVSGFYSYNCTTDKIKKKITHILRILFLGVTSFFVFDVTVLLLNEDFQGVFDYILQYSKAENLIELLLLNVPVHRSPLWYLLAIFYVYIIYYFVTKIKISERVVFLVSIILLIVNLVLGEGLSAFGVFIPVQFIRNFVLMGIPFFGLGLIIRKYKDKLFLVPNYIVFILGIIGVVETLLSRYFFERKELYLGSLLILVAPVVWSIKYADNKYPNILKMIEGCSTYIYIFHIMISYAVNIGYSKLLNINYDSVFIQMIHPILVCIASTVFSIIINQVINKISKKAISKKI